MRGDENIVELYKELDEALAKDQEDEEIEELYKKILDLSFDRLTYKLTRGEKFDFDNKEDLYSARGVYEHALERWDSGDFKGAEELFGVLSYLVPAKYTTGMVLGLGLTSKRVPLDQFFDEYVDKSRLDESSLFFIHFTPKADQFLAKNSRLIEEKLESIANS